MARKAKVKDVYANEVEDKIVEVPEVDDYCYEDDLLDMDMNIDNFREDW